MPAWNKGTGKKSDPRACPTCGVRFTPPYKKRNQRFCSRSCAGKMLIPLDKMLSAEAREKNRRSQPRLGTGSGYRKLYGRHEHRVVAEKILGRELKRGEIVHHIDGNRANNDPSNLAIMTQREHMKVHGLGIPGQQLLHKPWEARRKANDNISSSNS